MDAVVAQLERVCELEVARTERAGHAVELAREVDSGAVVGVGGDGTANEVANGVGPGVLMGVLPAGASSVFARHLGFPRDIVAAGGMMADAIRNERTKPVGLGHPHALPQPGREWSIGFGLDVLEQGRSP